MIDRIYRCELCGVESDNPVRWIVIHCKDSQMTLFKWTKESADAPHARHYCGEAHAQIFISRWFESPGGNSKSEQSGVIEFAKKQLDGVRQQSAAKL
jgi:hypothetical protein